MLTNLLANALDHSPDDGRVEVSVAGEAGGVLACVRDSGPGVPLEQRARVFERFFRGSDDRTNGHAGLGLGLYIASEIVRRHGGRIWVEETAGGGATFCFWLPEAPASA